MVAFVNEFIPPADRQRVDFSDIKRAPFYRDTIDPQMWTIDRDADVFLVRTGSGREEDYDKEYFALKWRGHTVDMRLQRRYEWQKTVLVWTIDRLRLPPELEPAKSEFLQVLGDALAVHGLAFTRQGLNEVRCDF